MKNRRSFKAVEKRLAGVRPLLTTRVTSERMARVRRQGTAPELAVRRVVSGFGHRYTLQNKDLPGSPDLANRSKRWVIFVHGCYWHHHHACSRATVPKSNTDFWKAKFAANRQRDTAVANALRRRGYAVYTLWECGCQSSERVARALNPLRDSTVRH
jgi:DNA mismatch endonuclease (patch repair protein)